MSKFGEPVIEVSALVLTSKWNQWRNIHDYVTTQSEKCGEGERWGLCKQTKSSVFMTENYE